MASGTYPDGRSEEGSPQRSQKELLAGAGLTPLR